MTTSTTFRTLTQVRAARDAHSTAARSLAVLVKRLASVVRCECKVKGAACDRCRALDLAEVVEGVGREPP